MKKLLLLLLLIAPALRAQTTTVSGTITDSGGQSWNFGSVQLTFRPADSNPTAQYFYNGALFDKSTTLPQNPQALDPSGAFSGLVVPSNDFITPSGSTWTVKVCPAATTACFSKNLSIIGATLDISGSVIPPPVHLDLGNPPPGAAAYTDSEVFGAKPGSFYYNITSNNLHMCEITPFPPCTWLSLSGGGSVASFTSGNLPPIFTTNVTNPTTTVSQTFSLSNAAANTVLGNCTSSPAPPLYCSISNPQFNHNILWVDGSQFSTLSAALAACTTKCWIIDTLPETFASNPFTGFTGQAQITWGPGTWLLNAQVIAPATVGKWDGSGRQGTGMTVFKKGGSLAPGTTLIKALGTQGQVFSNMVIDCDGLATSTAMLATDWNENSGMEKSLILNCPVIGLNVDASGFASIPAQNYFVRDVEIFSQTAGSGTTIGLQLKGNGGGGPADVRDITANGAGGHVIQSSVEATNWQQGHISNIHGENATNVFHVPASGISAFILDHVTGATTDTNIVNIDAASGANSFVIRNIATNAGPTTLIDGPRSITLTDQFIPFYEVGGGSVGQQDLYSSSLNIPKHFATGFSLPYALKSSANYTLLKTDGIINLTTGTTTLTVPHALTGQFWFVRNSQGTGDITASCDSGNINGVATVNLVAETGVIAYADGTNCFLNSFPQLVASGTAAMTTALIASGACGATVTVGATGVLTTDTIDEDFNAAVTAGNNGLLIFHKWPTAGNVNFNYCNPGAGNVTPTAMTVNWSVRRP